MKRGPLIAIDGPAGSGKSTLARRLAETLDLPYLNTGLMYRALTLEARRRGVDVEDGAALGALAEGMDFRMNDGAHPPHLQIAGATPGPELATPEVEDRVSRVARHPQVRAVLRAQQGRLSIGGAVVEGRDIGTVVAPHADVKLYLEAQESERIARRTHERRAIADETRRALSARDALDAHTNPLEPAEDAVAIDTTLMDEDEVFEAALVVVRAKLQERGW